MANEHVGIAAAEAQRDSRLLEGPAKQFAVKTPRRFRRRRQQVVPDDAARIAIPT
jgi:hypothetical protein